MSLNRALALLGRTLIGGGILVFLFIGFQLYVTGISENRAQNELKKSFEAATANTTTTSTSITDPNAPVGAPPPTTAAPLASPPGSAIAIMRIPKIHFENAVVEGTGVSDLKKGPGHYSGTPLPGQDGNASIAGHRTTYGAPFGDIGELSAGDTIEVATKQGHFVYRVTGHHIVKPSDVSVLGPTQTPTLTLTTCHPKYSAAQRLIVTAALEKSPTSPAPAPPPMPTTSPPNSSTPTTDTSTRLPTTVAAPQLGGAGLSGEKSSNAPAFAWAFMTVLVALSIWILSITWNRRWAYIAGTPVFFVTLFIFFQNVSRLLPANA